MNVQVAESKLSLVERLRNAAIAGEFDLFKSFLKDDLVIKVGVTDEIKGPQAAVDFFIDMTSKKIQLTGLEAIASWEMEDAVIVEYYMKGNRVSDDRYFEFPCVDIYYFDGDRIGEWHVYPMYRAFVAE
jgi:hypothetical protein